jgi:hypothetical protein|tara:strand:+ start:666 stop:1445 length:780 start_codon:yes stop_codon:yes gene_type:complete
MSDSVASRYADAVARIQARRRIRLSGLPLTSSEANKKIIENHKTKTLESTLLQDRENSNFVTASNSSSSVAATKSLEGGAQDSLKKCPVEFPPSTHFNVVDVQLMETIKEHQNLISIVTTGADMLLIVSSLDELTGVEPARRTAVHCTPDLQKLVWRNLEGQDTGKMSFVNIEDITALVCIFAEDLENTFLPKTAPILRVMVRGADKCYDFVCSDESMRKEWARGLSLAYGLQTCPISKTNQIVATMEEGESKQENLFS